MEYIRMSRVKQKLAAALYLIDEFTGKQVEYPATVTANQNQKAIRKSDGYYLVMDDGSSLYEIVIESSVYQTVRLQADKNTLNPRLPVIIVRLLPSRSYPVPNGTKVLQGQYLPDTALYFVEKREFARLLSDYQTSDKRKLSLYTEEEENLDESLIYIKNIQRNQGEMGKISACTEKESCGYLLEDSLKNDYTKAECRVYRVLTVRTDSEGYYFYPIRTREFPELLRNTEES